MKTKQVISSKKAYSIIALLLAFLLIVSLTPIASATQHVERANSGSIAIKEMTGVPAGSNQKYYSAMDGNEVTYSLIMHNLVQPRSLALQFDDGIEFQEVTYTSVFATSPVKAMDWELDEVYWGGDGVVRFDISDLPSQVRQLIITFKCKITKNLADNYSGSAVHATFFSKKDDITSELSSSKIYGLHFDIKTVDGKLKKESDSDEPVFVPSGTFELYYDENYQDLVYFVKKGSTYTAVSPENSNAVTEISNENGLMTLQGLLPGNYYLVQTEVADDNRKLTSDIVFTLDAVEKYDPNDPANIKENEKAIAEANKFKPESQIEFEKRRKLEQVAAYHAAHPKEYIPTVCLDGQSTKYVSVCNTEEETSITIDFNPHIRIPSLLKKPLILFGTGCVCSVIIAGVMSPTHVV